MIDSLNAGFDEFGELSTSSQDEDDDDSSEEGSSDDDARLFLYAHEVEPNTMQDVVDEMGLQGNVHLTGRLQVSRAQSHSAIQLHWLATYLHGSSASIVRAPPAFPLRP